MRDALLLTSRPARREEAAQLAILLDMASQGLVSQYWSGLAAPLQSPFEIGRTRVRDRDDLPSHYSRWTVLEDQGEICGGCATYRVPDPYDPGDISGLSKAYVPLLELEALAKGCWFVGVLAVFPEFRRQGVAKLLLQVAEDEATQNRASHIALVVSDRNLIARELYVKSGFIETARRPRVADSGVHQQDEWLLLMKQLAE